MFDIVLFEKNSQKLNLVHKIKIILIFKVKWLEI